MVLVDGCVQFYLSGQNEEENWAAPRPIHQLSPNVQHLINTAFSHAYVQTVQCGCYVSYCKAQEMYYGDVEMIFRRAQECENIDSSPPSFENCYHICKRMRRIQQFQNGRKFFLYLYNSRTVDFSNMDQRPPNVWNRTAL